MSFSPIDASLYVTFTSISHPDSCLVRITNNRTPNPLKEDKVIKATISAMTKPPSELAPYTAIMYAFSKSLHQSFLQPDISAYDMIEQVVEQDKQSDLMLGLFMTQLDFLHETKVTFDTIKRKNPVDPLFSMPSIRKKTELVRTIFDDSKSQLTSWEYRELLDAAISAQSCKDQFTYVNSLLIPR